jgi:hypothetical protein
VRHRNGLYRVKPSPRNCTYKGQLSEHHTYKLCTPYVCFLDKFFYYLIIHNRKEFLITSNQGIRKCKGEKHEINTKNKNRTKENEQENRQTKQS